MRSSSSASSSQRRCGIAPLDRGIARSRASENRGPRSEPRWLSRRPRRCARWPSSWCQTKSAAPSAPPASPAAGWIQICSNGPSRRSRPLATQLSATPPARHRLRQAGLRVDVARHAQHDLLGDQLDRRREVHLALRDRRLRLAAAGRRRARRSAAPVIVRPGAVVEVLHVQAERAVVLEVDQLLEDEVGVARLAVGREAHQLVLAGVDLEAGEVGERGVEQPERVREVQLLRAARCALPLPMPIDAVAHSPTPSRVRIAASSNGDGKNALAACDSWCSVKTMPLAVGLAEPAVQLARVCSFFGSHTGIALRNESKPRGA